MALSKRYRSGNAEVELQSLWQNQGTYHFAGDGNRPVFAIDTPPPTVSGRLHLGHVYSYSQADFIARYQRMRGDDVLYPMGFDDNGLPTERLVERSLGIRATEVGRQAFIEKCLAISEEAEGDYRQLWQRLGLSIDWRYTYRTIDDNSRRLSQLSFLDLFHKGLAYRRRAPAIWCPECRTAIAQAELADLDRQSEFVTISFTLDDGTPLPIATTRPELLAACVAIFVHPDDDRFQHLIGRSATVPLFGQTVKILADPAAEPDKGTGIVMCCTFGDTADVAWWYTYDLDLVEAIGRDGHMTAASGKYAGLATSEARMQIKSDLAHSGLLLDRHDTSQSIRVHERCDTPVEYVVTTQWFVRVLQHKQALLDAGERVEWRPAHMKARYLQWVENLSWDWCISRQRYFGVTFPVWYCDDCGQTIVADLDSLPIDPTESEPGRQCDCGGTAFTPERDVMDTWATSSLTPQFVGQMLGYSGFDGQSFQPVTLRPQAHEIIRTWAFYSIVKSQYHFGCLPWQKAAISGWGLAPEGTGKISKSRGGGPMSPLEMIERYSADAVRYWAASTSLGKDAIISEDKIQAGAKLVNKLWNVARFSQRFIAGHRPPERPPELGLADRWILNQLADLLTRATGRYDDYDYAAAKSETENFFWTDLADNYLELAKKRLYEGQGAEKQAARYTLYQVLLVSLKLLAPVIPHVTEAIYLGLFAGDELRDSIHTSPWPAVEETWFDRLAADQGQSLLAIATTIRRYKSDHSLSLGAELPDLHIESADAALRSQLQLATTDIMSVTRAVNVTITDSAQDGYKMLPGDDFVTVYIRPPAIQ